MSIRAIRKDPIAAWLLLVAFLTFFMVVLGGYVRLSRAGLSIVEWNVITGVVPPLSEDAWQEEFAKYQQTPEYQLVNKGMSLDEYKEIFLIEWFHRLVGRIAGLLVVVPLIVYGVRGIIPWRDSWRYWLIAALFGVQGAIGWLMVASGLVDRPAVSHLRLTIHLLTALSLFALTLWMAFNRIYADEAIRRPVSPTLIRLAWVLLVVLVIQIAYGGLVAGLKAGYVSDTWPLMFGSLVPPKLFSVMEPWWVNLFETPLTVHFIHRWFAFVVATVVVILAIAVRRQGYEHDVVTSTNLLIVLVTVQIALGIRVVILGVPKWLAIAHQGTAVLLLGTTIFLLHRLQRAAPVAVAVSARPAQRAHS
nr:COX15/CtaA family protein [Ardenticatena sp.]